MCAKESYEKDKDKSKSFLATLSAKYSTHHRFLKRPAFFIRSMKGADRGGEVRELGRERGGDKRDGEAWIKPKMQQTSPCCIVSLLHSCLILRLTCVANVFGEKRKDPPLSRGAMDTTSHSNLSRILCSDAGHTRFGYGQKSLDLVKIFFSFIFHGFFDYPWFYIISPTIILLR